MLHHGLYEQVINNALTGELAEIPEARKSVAPIDKAEASKVLAQYLADVVQKGLDNVLDNGGDISAQIGLTNQIVDLIQNTTQGADFVAPGVDRRAEQLLVLLRETDPRLATGKTAADIERPETSIAQSSLFTGAVHEPQMFISDKEKDYLHFYCAVRSILFKLTKGDAPDISQMNARVRELLEGAIQSDGIEELFETGKHISVDIFSDEYLDKINAIQLPNTKIKVLQRLLSQAIDEYKKVNRIMGMEFSDRLKRVVDEYNNRRRDEAFANEVLDDVAEQLAKLLEELKKEKDSFKGMGIDYEEKAFYDILKAVAKKYEFEYPDDKMIELSKRIKIIVDDKAKYTDWSTRDDIKANLQVDLILLLDEFDYPPVTIDDVYKEVLEQAENFKKYAQ